MMEAMLFLLLLASNGHLAAAGSFFPCHNAKGLIHSEVKCISITLPHSICSRCPLRQTLGDGSFEECDRIYDTSSSQCMNSLQHYVNINPCDVRRASALNQLKAGDESVREELDYFLYSVCEQCCDCIPMGAQRSDYFRLSQKHSTSSPALWSETRGNCPAHARYDVCKIFPFIQSFGRLSNEVPICDQLSEWMKSESAEEWEINPNVGINADIQMFLRDILVATKCEESAIWEKCQVMEDKQHHLDLDSGFETENAPVIELPQELTPDPIPNAVETVPNSPGSHANTSHGNGEETVSFSGENPVSTVQTPSETAGADLLSDVEGDGSTSANPDMEIEEDGISHESVSHSQPILHGIRSCFPGSSTVRRRDGAVLRMEDLNVGDEILVSNARYSPIFTFSHRSRNTFSKFVKIRTMNHSLYLSSEHKLYVNGEMRIAGSVKKGEYVQGEFVAERVVHVRRKWKWGLYNPHTIDGEMVVDGILCSCFTDAVSMATAQGLLSPFRGAFMIGAKDWMLGWLLRDGVESLVKKRW